MVLKINQSERYYFRFHMILLKQKGILLSSSLNRLMMDFMEAGFLPFTLITPSCTFMSEVSALVVN